MRQVTWTPRDHPLEVVAVCGFDAVAAGLRAVAAVRSRPGAPFRVAEADDAVVLLGHEKDLPWLDGVTYLGWEGEVLVPTTLVPTPPADLVRPLLARGSDLIVLVPGHVLVSRMPWHPADPALLERRVS